MNFDIFFWSIFKSAQVFYPVSSIESYDFHFFTKIVQMYINIYKYILYICLQILCIRRSLIWHSLIYHLDLHVSTDHMLTKVTLIHFIQWIHNIPNFLILDKYTQGGYTVKMFVNNIDFLNMLITTTLLFIGF